MSVERAALDPLAKESPWTKLRQLQAEHWRVKYKVQPDANDDEEPMEHVWENLELSLDGSFWMEAEYWVRNLESQFYPARGLIRARGLEQIDPSPSAQGIGKGDFSYIMAESWRNPAHLPSGNFPLPEIRHASDVSFIVWKMLQHRDGIAHSTPDYFMQHIQ